MSAVLRWASAALLATAAASGAAACKSSGVALSIDLRTDYLPGREFFGVRTEIVAAGGDDQRADKIASGSDPFVEGARVADFGDLPTGGVQVKVAVLSADGQPIVERLARVSIQRDYALTLVITRNCEGVTCPQPGGDAALSTCDRGQCVRAECTPQTPQFCAPPECATDGDCKADVACVKGRCAGGTCLFLPDDSRCDPKQTCDAATGCTPPLGPACTSTSTSETNCKDGVDDDCDGRIDCNDPDCNAKPCEDGDLCTEGETCGEAACTGGTPKSCDDGNGCTDDACDPKSGCVHADNTAPCDDGQYCNGADTCDGGACVRHAGDPCAKGCDEASDKCLSCASDADCGPVTYGAWGACGGFASACATSGTRTRSVATPTCVAGACTTVRSTESGACTRVTDGVACGTTTYGAWSACGGYSSACDTSGTRTRAVTAYACAAGACAAKPSTETGTCARSVADGTACGTDKYCCGAVCYAKSDPNHCSSCGIKCAAGRKCASIGAGRWSCTCGSNSECVGSGFGSGATCWNPPPGTVWYCNCQCTTAGCCAGGASCFKPSGNNYCSY